MRDNQKGSALIIVMCVMIITVVLSLSLLLVSSVMNQNAARSNQKEQCRISAVAVSEVLREQIKTYKYAGIPTADYIGTKGLEGKLQSVWTKEWLAYDKAAGSMGQIASRNKNYFTYHLEGSGLPGDTVLELYWIDEMEDGFQEPDSENPEEAADKFGEAFLYVKVTNTVGEESSTIISKYHPVVDENWTSWYWDYLGRDWERGNS